MRRVVLITFTPKEWSGGVNRWVRDFMSGYENSVHYSWWDLLSSQKIENDPQIPEWDKARVLNQYLIWSKKIDKDDIIVVDGFWGLGLEAFPNVVSVAHGIWSHQTLEDVEQGKPADFPFHHRAQVEYRKKHVERRGRIVAVSDFISTEMRRQWGFSSRVINNAIDLNSFKPHGQKEKFIVHGVNDPGNENKGWNHIQHVKKNVDREVLSLDEAHSRFGFETKAETLAAADFAVIPSAYEGNSYFCLETLACDVPIISYNVGLMYTAWGSRDLLDVGVILDRKNRSPEYTFSGVQQFLNERHVVSPREWVSKYSVERFHDEWRSYIKSEFGL